jgi:SAM-dependent methyltransferase
MSRWDELSVGGGERYAERFASLAAAGHDVHGEASLCATLVTAGARILDAGCGTGRVAVRLSELGYDCVGIDNDISMLDVARRASDAVRWVRHDLAGIADLSDLDLGPPFDLVVAAGNVIPLLSPGTEATVVAGIADRLRPDGVLVAGFGLAASHLPLDDAPFGLTDYDVWCKNAGLELARRLASWDGAPYDDGPYAVSVHTRTG